MVDFTQDQAPSGKKIANHFATVRERGMLNAGMQAFEDAYVESHPGMMVRWERYAPSKENGTDDVVFRESQGWRLVDAAELNIDAPSASKSGYLRRGDLVMMAIDAKTGQYILDQDARAAQDDSNAPKRAFNDALDAKKVRLSDGSEDQARGVGTVKVQEQFVTPRPDTIDSGGGS